MDEEKNLNEAAEEVTEAAENIVNETADTAEETTAEVVDEVKDTAEETAAEAVDEVKDAADNVVEEVTDAAQDVAEAAEDTAEEVTAAVSEAAEDAVDTVSEAAEETADMLDGAAESAEEAAEGAAESAEEAVQYGEDMPGEVTEPENKTTKAVVIAVCAVLAAAIIVLAIIFVPKLLYKNPYEKYVDTTGRTIGEVAEMSGMEYDKFLETYSLPADMPEDTSEASAFNTIPISKVLEIYQYEDMATVDEAKSFLALPDWVDENTPWGDAIGEAPLKNYVGEENLDDFLEHYGLQDTATGDTLFKEVRQTVDEADKKEREEYEKQMEELQAQMEEQQSQSDGETQTEAPADDQAQTEQTADGQAAEQTDAADTEAQPVQ